MEKWSEDDVETFKRTLSSVRRGRQPLEGREEFFQSQLVCGSCFGGQCDRDTNDKYGIRCIQCHRSRRSCPRQVHFHMQIVANRMSKPLEVIAEMYKAHGNPPRQSRTKANASAQATAPEPAIRQAAEARGSHAQPLSAVPTTMPNPNEVVAVAFISNSEDDMDALERVEWRPASVEIDELYSEDDIKQEKDIKMEEDFKKEDDIKKGDYPGLWGLEQGLQGLTTESQGAGLKESEGVRVESQDVLWLAPETSVTLGKQDIGTDVDDQPRQRPPAPTIKTIYSLVARFAICRDRVRAASRPFADDPRFTKLMSALGEMALIGEDFSEILTGVDVGSSEMFGE